MKTILLIVLLLLGAPSGAYASDPIMGLDLGMPLRAVKARLNNAGFDAPRVYRSQQPQALRKSLIETGLLALGNAAGGLPQDEDQTVRPETFDRILVASNRFLQVTATFGPKRTLQLLAVRVAVPVESRQDRGPRWSSNRLVRRRAVLERLRRYHLHPTQTDRYGNRFAWRGATPRGQLFVRYVPEDDEMQILLHPLGSSAAP